MDCKEIQIPVPWGHVAAKLWGKEENEAILTFHGLLDNAGSFDNLIAILPTSYYYICIDLPGHGRSSHFPSTLPIHSTDNIIVYKAVAEYFKRSKYILMGHSYGAQLGIMFAQLYPDYISKLIMLDTFYLYPAYPALYMNNMISSHDQLFKTLKQTNDSKPVYTYEEALDKMVNNRRFGQLTNKSAGPILKRMIEPVGEDKYVFMVDQRLKCIQNPSANFQYVIDLFNKLPIKCPVLIIIASKSKAQTVFFRPLYKHFKKLRFNMQVVDGDHDVHNTYPEKVAPIITKFLLSKRSKL